MRPRNHQPRSVSARKRDPSACTRSAETPPNCLNDEVSTRPPRNSSIPKRNCDGLPGAKAAIGFAAISIGDASSAPPRDCAATETARIVKPAAQPVTSTAPRKALLTSELISVKISDQPPLASFGDGRSFAL